MKTYNPYDYAPYHVPRKMTVVDHFYRERSISLATASKQYYKRLITAKKYTETCRDLNLNTAVLIEEFEQALLVNKLKGVKDLIVKSLDGSEINLIVTPIELDNEVET